MTTNHRPWIGSPQRSRACRKACSRQLFSVLFTLPVPLAGSIFPQATKKLLFTSFSSAAEDGLSGAFGRWHGLGGSPSGHFLQGRGACFWRGSRTEDPSSFVPMKKSGGSLFLLFAWFCFLCALFYSTGVGGGATSLHMLSNHSISVLHEK